MISPVSIDCWKRWPNIGRNSVASSFRTLGWSSLGLKALEGFTPLRSLVTAPLETTISSMKGADLSGSGPGCVHFIEHIRKLTIKGSAFSRSDWATTFPFLLFRDGIPQKTFLPWRSPKTVQECSVCFSRCSPRLGCTESPNILYGAMMKRIKCCYVHLSVEN